MNLPSMLSWEPWTTWAKDSIVNPLSTALVSGQKEASRAVFQPFVNALGNLRLAGAAALVNNPADLLRQRIANRLKLADLPLSGVVRTILQGQAGPVRDMLNDYLARLDSIELAVSALLDRQLPIVEAVFADLKTLLSGQAATTGSMALTKLFDAVSGGLHQLLAELDIVATPTAGSGTGLNLAPGHLHDWICCRTTIDNPHSDEQRKQQQRLRLTMMKVILSYVESAPLSPGLFLAPGAGQAPAKSAGGFAQSSTSASDILHGATGFMRAYAGIVAAACEHIFVSSRPLPSQGPNAATELYHDLPLTLKLQRPDLFKLAFGKPGCSPFADPESELNSEFLAMRMATTCANVTAGAARTAITCIGNGVWQFSPNNPPLVDTVASLIAIPLQALEKALIYDVLRRFRVYVTDKPIAPAGNPSVLMYTVMTVPDFATVAATEKQVTAAVAVLPGDTKLLDAAKTVFPRIPLALDDLAPIDTNNELFRLLHGTLRDALAIGFVISAC